MRQQPRPDSLPPAANDDARDPLSAARGCLNAAAISTVLIALLIAGARALFMAVRP